MLNLAPDFDSNNATFLIKTMRRLLNNRRELERLIIQARENLRSTYGASGADSIPIVKLEIEIIRIATEKTYQKHVVEEADTMIGERFRNKIYKIEKEYCSRKDAIKRSKEIYSDLGKDN